MKLKNIMGLVPMTKLQELNVYGYFKLDELLYVENLRSMEKLQEHSYVKLKSLRGWGN